ncbi:hypothetical protein CORC01_02323 [Colletotrichum orchidophilum]|uniref:Uncharacterized protein n=1 Tax=Colletotrichum orchidophilum TaxID=1209926 RepID=A0A1G4BLH8_9PEZI|nr:uncharacterized protein CORC01_02323 [Colletotrichum orchidophilum]OHF02330.1 hypothetical protein CORC01_02323 [Colletotrichum orchidophilum]
MSVLEGFSAPPSVSFWAWLVQSASCSARNPCHKELGGDPDDWPTMAHGF